MLSERISDRHALNRLSVLHVFRIENAAIGQDRRRNDQGIVEGRLKSFRQFERQIVRPFGQRLDGADGADR
jgi:hypothetical protein